MVGFFFQTKFKTDVGIYYSRPSSIYGLASRLPLRCVRCVGVFTCAHALACSLAGLTGGHVSCGSLPIPALYPVSHVSHVPLVALTCTEGEW